MAAEFVTTIKTNEIPVGVNLEQLRDESADLRSLHEIS